MNLEPPACIDGPVKASCLFAVVALLGCASTPDAVGVQTHVDGGFVTAHDPMLERACAGLERSESLICRSDRRLIAARARGDSTLVACLSGRGRELRAIWRQIGESRAQLTTSAQEARAEVDREKLQHAERALEQSYARLDDCPGSVDDVVADSVRVVRPALAETDDFPR